MSDRELLLDNNELLHSLLHLLRIGLGLGVAILLAVLATLVSKWVVRKEMVNYLRRSDETHQRAATLLEIVQGWGESGRAARKDTAEALKKVASGPSREELAQKVEAIPEQTAAKVVEKIKTDGPAARLGDSR